MIHREAISEERTGVSSSFHVTRSISNSTFLLTFVD